MKKFDKFPTSAVEKTDVFADLLSEAKGNAKALRVMPKVIADIMEEVHGQKFRIVVDHDAPMILIRAV